MDDFLRGSELGKQVSVGWGPHRPPLSTPASVEPEPEPSWEGGGGARPGDGSRSVWEVEI